MTLHRSDPGPPHPILPIFRGRSPHSTLHLIRPVSVLPYVNYTLRKLFSLVYKNAARVYRLQLKNRENAVKLRRGSPWHGKFDEDKSNISQDIEQRSFKCNEELESRSRSTTCKPDMYLVVRYLHTLRKHLHQALSFTELY